MTRRLLCPSALALSFLVGCAGEESTTPDATPAPPISNPSAPSAAKVKAESEASEKAPAPEKTEAKAEEKAPELTPAPEKAPAGEPKKAEDKAPAEEPKKAEDKAPAEEPKKADAKPSLEGPSGDAGAAKLTEEDLAEIKKLPADEQASALTQVICPVSEHNLGSMGVPIKKTIEGRTFYICCEGCEKKVKNDPKAVIAELDKIIKK